MRQIVLTAAILVVVAGASAAPEPARYRDPHFGWTLKPAAGFHLAVVDARPGMRFSLKGAIVASFPVSLREGRFDKFPADGVAFSFLNRAGGPAPDLQDPEPRFPLARKSFVRGYREPVAPPPLYRHVVANGHEFDASVWIGPSASKSSRERIWRVVGSLRFPHLRPGQMTGPFAVLAPRERYPLRSATRRRTPAGWKQPFYLVRAPGGFYALGWRSWIRPGYLPCDVRFDRARFQFFCRASGARWDRVGRVLVNPDPSRFQDVPLGLLLTKISWDGHVLVSDNYYDYPTAADDRRYWPRGR